MFLLAVVGFFLAGAIFSGYLLVKKSVKAISFCFMLLTFFGISALTYRLDDIIGIKYKDAEITLQKIEKDADATISAVREVGKINLQLAADLATRIGYAGSSLNSEELQKYRERMDGALDSLKVSESEKKEILKIFPNRMN